MVKLGIDRIDDYLYLFEGKRVGLITNPTGLDSKHRSTIDILNEKVNLVALFSPEHGVRADHQAGERFDSFVDQKTGIMAYSLYSKSKKPSKEMMDSVDIVCIDIQDPGSRFYTFIYTMAYVMIACKEYDKEFVVFDRPNPINGVDYEGNILDMNYRSFIGYFPIVQRHGLTIAEVAKLFNEEYGIGSKLTCVLMENWDRNTYFNETGLMWVMPSPNLPTVEAAVTYNATCIFEGTNVEEGRGTTAPFQFVGAPYIDPYDYADSLNSLNLEGVYFRPLYFTPTFSKYPNQLCGGVEVHVLDRKTFKPVKVGFAMLEIVRKMYPNDFTVDKPYKEGMKTMLQYNTGCDYIQAGTYTLEEQFEIIEKDTKTFGEIRQKYLLY